jgi:quercetin dioxygenase-like cupin family protein
MADAWQSRPERPAAVPLRHIRISEQIERLKQEPTWRTGDRNAITLIKEPTLRLVLIALKKGAKLHEHQAGGPITIQAVSGSLRLTIAGRASELRSGEIAVLESAIGHEVEALEEVTLLLTLVKPT